MGPCQAAVRATGPTASNHTETTQSTDDQAAELDRLCERLVGRLSHGSWVLRRDQEDLLQEARLLAWQHAGHPLAARVIKLRLIDRIRAMYGRSSNSHGPPVARAVAAAEMRSLDSVRGQVVGLRAGGESVEDTVIARDAARRMSWGLHQLPVSDRALLLASLRGTTLQELAGELGLSESGVWRRRALARERLRDLLAQAPPQPAQQTLAGSRGRR